MIKQKRILITGANGFIGSHLVEKAVELGYEVWAGVRANSDYRYLKGINLKFVDLAYNNKAILASQLEELKRFDYIIHNAGITKCIDKKDFDTINFLHVVNFVEALRKSKTIPDKLVLVSSLSVMGIGDEKNYTPFRLSDIPRPNTAYGKSKLKAEQFLREQIDIPHIIFRPTGVYGPREKDYLMMIKSVKKGLSISAGLKAQHLTFIYVKDLANIIFRGIDSRINNETYFVSDGNVHTNEEYAELIKKILNKKCVLSISIPLFIIKTISLIAETISKITNRPSTLNRDKYIIMKQRNWECDVQPLIDDLDFSPQYNLSKGLEESIKWYKKEKWL